MTVKIAACTSDGKSVGTLPEVVPGEITALIIDSPLQMVNTITGTSRATIHLIKRRRVSRSGKNVRELTDVDTLASPRFQQAMITTLKHARLLYTFSGVCEPRRPEGRKTRIKM